MKKGYDFSRGVRGKYAKKEWHWPESRSGEFLCSHGTGHDRIPGHAHGCDGCCGLPGFDKALRRYRERA